MHHHTIYRLAINRLLVFIGLIGVVALFLILLGESGEQHQVDNNNECLQNISNSRTLADSLTTAPV